ncbi:MAG: putative glycoside hydrolase [Gemmatimonadota bacterium]|nr:putative glycoside hydrolase [Gemmatimonadota bacterium]
MKLIRLIRLSILAVCTSVACTGAHDAAAAKVGPLGTDSSVTDAPRPAVSGTPTSVGGAPMVATARPMTPGLDSAIKGLVPIRGLYLYRFAPQNWKRLHHLIDIADSTEINAFVIDVKDEFGLNFHSSDPILQRNEGTQVKVRDLKAVVDTIRAHGILPIARMVVFKDSVTARMNPDHTIRKQDGSPWRDKKGLTWVNPYANTIWEYNMRVAEEAARMGFAEVQFDYIRFPEPYPSLPQQVFPEQRGRTKPQVLSEFLDAARVRMHKLGVRTTADIFGLVTTVGGALEVGQQWEPIAKSVDVILPMTYPSHYPHGSFGIARPNSEPYQVVHIAISRARERNEKIGLTGERVRPWIQAFSLGLPKYGPDQINEQKRAIYDSGFDGWVLWEPGSRYDSFIPAFEKKLVSRKKNPPVPRPSTKLD